MPGSIQTNKLNALLNNGDKNLVVTDNTLNDVSTSAHGFCPKAPNDSAKFLRGDATWANPSTPIWDYTVTGSAVTSATTNGTVTLDGLAHGGYRYEFIIRNTSGGNRYYRIYYNNDTTNTNYYCNWQLNARVNDAFLATDAGAAVAANNNEICLTGIISVTPAGLVKTTGTRTSEHDMYGPFSHYKIAAVANLTRIDIVADAASGISVNSRFRLWRMT